MSEPVSVALLGAGIFARDAYLPLLRFSPDARAFAGEAGLQELLAAPGIAAALVVLPVDAAPGVSLRCLRAGKHVLQEKPVAPDVAGALRLARAHAALSAGPGGRRPVCAIAENYRSERAFREAADALRAGTVGDVIKLDLVADMPMSAGNKYFGSAWRRDAAACPGCFLMDSSVHFVAALRALAAAAGFGEAVSAAGAAYGTADALPAPDALVGHVRFRGGRGAGVSISFGCALPRFALTATGTRGALEVQRGGWAGGRGEYRLLRQAAGEAAPSVETLAFSGLEDELSAFVAQVRGEADADTAYRTSLMEGVRDLAVIEALLASSAQGGSAVPVHQGELE